MVVEFGGGLEEWRSCREGRGIVSKDRNIGTCASAFSFLKI